MDADARRARAAIGNVAPRKALEWSQLAADLVAAGEPMGDVSVLELIARGWTGAAA